jgi:hypothetical protein
MKTRYLATTAAIGALLLAGVSAHAQQPTPILVPSIGSTDIICNDVVAGQATPQTHCIPALMLGNFGATQPGNNTENALIGGDFGENLFQDGTTVSTITTTPTYVADQWGAFSGTSTTIGGAQETGAADITANFQASLRITRTGAGIIQSCVGQPLTTIPSTRFAGVTAELDFHALAGAGFSAANSALTAILVQSTGTNQSFANLGKTVNSALSGTAWTGATLDSVSVPITTSSARYSVAYPVLSTTTQLAALLCWTPVGASPSNDYFEFTGAQLVPNSGLASLTAGTTGILLNTYQAPMAKTFNRRLPAVEAQLQYSFYYRVNEGAAGTARGLCRSRTTTECSWDIKFPVPMWQLPTMSYTAGFAVETTTAGGTLGNCTSLAADTTVTSAVPSVFEAYALCGASTVPAAGTVDEVFDNGNSGVFKANARL